jgi:hypothetical protein
MTTDQLTSPKQKLRWLQYSLRTLMIVVTLFAVACSWFAVKMQQAKRQREAVEAIEKLGGRISYDYEWDSGSGYRITGAKPPGPTWLRKVLGDDFFCTVDFVDIHEVCLDPGMEHLKKLNYLRWLALRGATDDGLKYIIKELNQLQYLSLWEKKFTNEGLERLNDMKKLQHIDLALIQTTNTSMEHLQKLEQLKTLDLRQTQITDNSLAHLKGLTQLKYLFLPIDLVTDAGVEKLQKALPNLRIDHP